MASQQAVQAVKEVLASTYTLYLKTQNFHWNLQGPHFFAFHAAFEAQYDALSEVVDEAAEILRALNEVSPASFEEFGQLSMIQSTPGKLGDAIDMAKILLADHEAMVSRLKALAASLDEAEEAQVIDFLIGRWHEHEKTAWMLRSSVQ